MIIEIGKYLIRPSDISYFEKELRDLSKGENTLFIINLIIGKSDRTLFFKKQDVAEKAFKDLIEAIKQT